MPGDGEEDAAVVGARDQEGACRREETTGRGPGGHPGWGSRAAAASASSSRRTASTYTPVALIDRAGLDRELLAGLGVAGNDPGDPPVALREARDGHVVESRAAQVGERPRQGDRQPGVVELAVGVDDAPVQTLAGESSGCRSTTAAGPTQRDRPRPSEPAASRRASGPIP